MNQTPRTPAEPLVAVEVDGLTAAWNGESFTGHRDIVTAANFAAQANMIVSVHGNDVVAGTGTASGAAAALASFNPGRTLFPVLSEEAFEDFGIGATS